MTLEEQLVDLLIEKNYHISFAESCTGGLCCGTLVNVSNASRVLDMSFVT
ncbi:MAG: CinA family protein, partial [Ruminococcaceae bacterium]|nr:CinA family protein [Oscillospiraceae bacterium]